MRLFGLVIFFRQVVLERLGLSLEALWSVLEVSLEGPGASWRRLGSVLGYLGRFLGVLPIFKRSEAVSKASWERLWEGLGSSWTRLGDVWETS